MNIPSLSDYMADVQSRMVAGAEGDRLDAELVGYLTEVFTSEPTTETDLFNCIAFGHGCHAAAEVYRVQGSLGLAGLFYALGQDLLTKAIPALADLMASSTRQVVRH